jgi:peptidoglycan lytic transglycosylase G
VRRLLIFLLLLAIALWAGWTYELRRPVYESDQPLTLTVEPGMGVHRIGEQLHQMGLVRHPEIFRAVVMARGVAGQLKAGEYALSGRVTLDGIVDKLARGDVVRRVVTFPEGSDVEAMAQLVSTQGLAPAAFREAARNVSLVSDLDPAARDLEGYLFPDTYDVTRRPDAAAVLVKRMVQRFRAVIAPELPALKASGRSVRDVVTLASVVELETAQPQERPRVAAVFLNRLKKGIPLATDPTIIYALRQAGRWDGNIRRADLDIDSPYNTYRNAGLPPGPIASPGRASLQAALHPAPSEDLYFVSRNDGSHHFSRTFAEHQRAVAYYQRGQGAPPPGAPPRSPAPASPGGP